tara:strand:- start:187 stop:732 length:546 start_codon:yes stop_codon:yes gene_type:complete
MLLLKITKLFILFSVMFLISCSQVRDSAGVNRKSIDEFNAIENPPLVIPPDLDLIEPDQIKSKSIKNTEKELAEEILFGLEKEDTNDEKILSTMEEILTQAKVSEVSSDIRNQIDEQFAEEKKTGGILNLNWENEEEVLDAVKESERLRNKNFGIEPEEEEENLIDEEKPKVKKKKRFIFF